MSKTDKELTAEIVNNYVTSWHSKDGAGLISRQHLLDLIVAVNTTIKKLPEADDK